jgi:hypothetical protein
MAERNLCVDHVTIWRWIQGYAIFNQRIRCAPLWSSLVPNGKSILL